MIPSDNSEMKVQHILQQRAMDLARVVTDEADLSERIEMLVFKLASEKYAVDINFVTEIQSLCGLTPLMGVPQYWVGLINLRGRLVPVLDLRSYLGLGRYIPQEESRGKESSGTDAAPWNDHPGDGTGQVVYISMADILIGLLVNQALDVNKLIREDVHPFMKDDPNKQSRSVLGVTSDFVTVLDAAQLVSELSVIDKNE